jgi:hypothetical protein
MLFFYRRKPKPPPSTLFVPVLKLFKTTHRKKMSGIEQTIASEIPLDSGSPILLSGPKSKYGLGISLHFIIIPSAKKINTDLIWQYARQEMRSALLLEGLAENEAAMYAFRLIDPITTPPEVKAEYTDEDCTILENLQRLVTYQLLKGQSYTGTLESLSSIYGDLADTVYSMSANRIPESKEAADLFQDLEFRNIEATLMQEDIEKKVILDIQGKLKELTEFFALFSQHKYLKRVTPQETRFIEALYL